MLDQLGQPCLEGWSPAEIVSAVGVATNLCLLTFLARRRVAKDRKDTARWSVCPFANGEVSAMGHKHRQTRPELPPRP